MIGNSSIKVEDLVTNADLTIFLHLIVCTCSCRSQMSVLELVYKPFCVTILLQFASAPPQQSWWEEILQTNLKMMYKLCAALLFAGAAISTPVPGHGHHNNLQCFSKPYKQCHQKPIQNQRQECHEEYDVIVDTTYIEECEEIVTTHCEEQHTQVHHSSQVVGHDSHKIHGGYSHGYHKRDAEAGHQGYSSGPHCKNHVDHKCHKVPQQHERKVPRKECKTIVDTTYIEECEDIVHEQCHETHVQTHHSSKVVGHDSHVVDHHSHGYGYGH